jgi:hypothetical protein
MNGWPDNESGQPIPYATTKSLACGIKNTGGGREGILNGSSKSRNRPNQSNGNQCQQYGVLSGRETVFFLYEPTNGVQHGMYLSFCVT